MGKVNKKTQKKAAQSSRDALKAPKRKLEEEEEPVVEKKPKETEEVEEEVISDEEIDDEDIGDEEDSGEEVDDEEDAEEGAEEGQNLMDTDVEGFPLNEDDREGVINLLTQIFLRNGDVNVPELADALIAQQFGLVLGPAEDESDEENQNMVYGLLTATEIDASKEESPKYAKQLVKFIMERANKFAVKGTLKQFEETLATRVGFLINERMLHFPSMVVPHSFSSLRDDLDKMQKPYKYVLYIQKIRVADEEKAAPSTSQQQDQGGKKKKKGKAEKKRLAAEAVANAEILFDNVEDAELFKLTQGAAYYFDYHVHNDVEADSKFHVIEKDGKKFRPFRRAVLMDTDRFNAFVDKMTTFTE